MSVKINRVTNANCYVDGSNFLGRAEEITLPDVAAKMSDHKALGLMSEMELPAGLQKMSAKFKWNSIYPEVMKKTFNPYSPVRVQIRTSIERYEGSEKTGEVPCVIYLSGAFKKSGGLAFKAQDNVEMEHEMNVTAFKMEINREEIIDVDITANIWRVDGRDLLAEYRNNLGI